MDNPLIEEIYSGTKHRIYGIVENGRCLVKEFIDSLDVSAQKKIIYLLKITGDNGTPGNTEKFKKLKNEELYEFKSYQVRLLCKFEKDKMIILTHGFIKKKDKTDPTEIARANDLLKRYQERLDKPKKK